LEIIGIGFERVLINELTMGFDSFPSRHTIFAGKFVFIFLVIVNIIQYLDPVGSVLDMKES
jgi:hypothetical protein